MPDLEISRLPQLAGADLQGTDPIAVADISASETKKLTVADLLTFGVTFIGSNSISGDQIISLDGAKLLPDSVTAREIAPDAVGSSELADLSVDTAAIQDGAVTNVKLASDIDGSKILALSISDAQIIDLDGSKILSGTISTDQLGADCITAVQLANNSVDTAAVQNEAITNDQLAVNIDGSKILADSITSLELAPNSVGSSELADSSVDTAAIQDAAVTDTKLASGISGSKITDGSLSDDKISSLDGAKLFGNSVTANEIAENSIGSSELSDTSVDTAAVQDGAITDDKIASGIDGGKISSASITNVQLGPGSVTNSAIRDDAVTDVKIAGPIDASKLSSGSIPDTALGAVTDRGLDQSTGKIGIANLVTAGTQGGISWDEQGLITGASGTVPSGDLPVATDATTGVVSVPGDGGLAVDAAGALSIANAITAATKQGIQYDKHGSIINVSDTIPVASIPLATNSTIGGVKVPGPDVTVSSDGALTLGDSGVIAGTYPKVTVNLKGVVTAGTSLTASDIPELDADKITSGNLDGSYIADRSIRQMKLADNATCYIQEARPSSSPGTSFKGCLWYQESTAQLRIWNGNSFNPVGFGRLSQDNLRWGGIVNATTGLVVTLTDAGQTAQLTVGAPLPEASDALGGLYMVTDPGGNGIGVTPGITYDAGDWVLCINGSASGGWTRIDTMASGGGGGGASSLDQLTDVTITDAANGEILVYEGATGQWKNEPQAVESVSSVFGRTGDVVATNGDYDLGELGDVDLTSVAAATGDVLQYDGAEWVPINLAGTVPITSVGAGSGLTDSGSGTDVVLNVGSGTGITVNADDIEINRTVVDSWYVDVSGDTMTGPLVLSGDPTTNLQASTKKYVDDVAADAVIAGDAKYVEVSGDNMTGNLTLGTDKITLNATTGFIGVGVVPFCPLTVQGVGSSSLANFRNTDNGRATITLNGNNTIDSPQISSTGDDLNLRTNFTDRFRVRATSGDVLIGGTLPSAPNITLKNDGTGVFEQVGIGTDNPAELLELSADNNPKILFTDKGNYQYKLGITSNNKFSLLRSGSDTETITVNATGDVGIGTTNPQAKLHISNGAGGGIGRILIDTAGVSSGYDSRIDQTDTGLEFTVESNTRGFAFNTGSPATPKVTIAPQGNVGIGTDSPTNRLTVVDSSASGIRSQALNAQATGTNKALHVSNGNTTDTFNVSYTGKIFANDLWLGDLESAPNLQLNSDGSANFKLPFNVGRPDDFWAQGYYGIGSPDALGSLATQGSYAVNLTSNGYRNGAGTWTSLEVNDKTGASQIALNIDGTINFNVEADKPTGSASPVPTKMRLDSSGNLGLGTNGPQTKLQVNGAITNYSGNLYATNCYYNNEWKFFDTNRPSGFINMGSEKGRFTIAYGDVGVDPTEKVSILGNGNFGIGNTNPQETLDVNGTAKATTGKFGNYTCSANNITSSASVYIESGGTNPIHFITKDVNGDYIFFENPDGGNNFARLRFKNLGSNQIYTFPNASGTVALTSDITTPGNGQINVAAGTGISGSGSQATANQSGNTTRTLSLDKSYTDGLYLPIDISTLPSLP